MHICVRVRVQGLLGVSENEGQNGKVSAELVDREGWALQAEGTGEATVRQPECSGCVRGAAVAAGVRVAVGGVWRGKGVRRDAGEPGL